MARISWTAGNTGSWTDAANWWPAQVPASADDVVIAAPGTYDVSVDGTAVNSIVLNDAAAVVSSSGTFLVHGALSIQSGTLDIASGVVLVTDGASVRCGSAVFASQILNLSGSNTLAIGLPAFFVANINGFAPGDTITLSGSANARDLPRS